MDNTDQSTNLSPVDHPSSSTREIEVIFIRHAETQENVRVNALFSILAGLMQFRLPSLEQLSQVAHLVFLKEEDSDLSPRGAQQLLDMQRTLQITQFWKKNPFEACFYSPYIRAERTCMTLLSPSLHTLCNALDLLKEIPFYAHLSSKLREKTHLLEQFLLSTPYTYKRVVLVGHCKFFHTLLHPPGHSASPSELMWNCDIVRATMRVTRSSRVGDTQILDSQISWSRPVLVLRSPLSTAHPASSLLRYRIFQGGGGGSRDGVDGSRSR
ncbi:hypothetical protein EON65_59410, partial [archaeon]